MSLELPHPFLGGGGQARYKNWVYVPGPFGKFWCICGPKPCMTIGLHICPIDSLEVEVCAIYVCDVYVGGKVRVAKL